MISKIKYIIAISAFAYAVGAHAAAQCGHFKFDIDDSGKGFINGEMVTSQKTNFLAAKDDWNNIKLDMTLMPARDGNMYGYEFFKRNGKAWLNVELIRTNLNQGRIIGTFDCKRVKG